ncbi:MAG: hypothetical protein ACTSQI_02930 [Candidatus Helarchaeota archaeon]
MRLAEFKLNDQTKGALTWKVIERIQRTLNALPKNSMKYFSSTVARNQTTSVIVDMDLQNKEITINLEK